MKTVNEKRSPFNDAVYETTKMLLDFQRDQYDTTKDRELNTIRKKMSFYTIVYAQYIPIISDIGDKYDCTKYTNLIKRYMVPLASTQLKRDVGRSICKFYADMGDMALPFIAIDRIYINRALFGSNIEFLNDGTILIKVFIDVIHLHKPHRFDLANICIDDINSSSYDTLYYNLFDTVIASLKNMCAKDIHAESIDTTAVAISRVVMAKFLVLIAGKEDGDSILYRFIYGDNIESTMDESSSYPITITVKSSKDKIEMAEIADKESLDKLSASRDLDLISNISCLARLEKNMANNRISNDTYISNMSSIIEGIKYRCSLYPELNSEYCDIISKNIDELTAVAATTMEIGMEGIDKKKELSFQINIKDVYGNTEPVTITIFMKDDGYLVSYSNSCIIKGRYFIPFTNSTYYFKMLQDGYCSVFDEVDDMKESIYYQSKDMDIDHFNFVKKKLQTPIIKTSTKIDEVYMMRKPLISAAIYVTFACINLISHNNRKIILIDSNLLR